MSKHGTYNQLIVTPSTSQWPTSETVEWHKGDYLFVLFPVHIPRVTKWQRFLAGWAVPHLQLSVPQYDLSIAQSEISRKVTQVVDEAGELVNEHINMSSDTQVSSIARTIWSLCLPLFLFLHFWTMFNPPHDFISFIPVWLGFNIVIFVPLFMYHRMKKRINGALAVCNQALALKYDLSEHQQDQLFMFLQFNSPRQLAVVMAIKHRHVINFSSTSCTHDMSQTLIEVTHDSDEKPEAVHCIRNETHVCVPFMDESLNYPFRTRIDNLKRELEMPRSCFLKPFFHFFISINTILSIIIPCDPHLTHVSSYSHVLSPFMSSTSYDHLTQSLLQSMHMGWFSRMLACSAPLFILTGIGLVLSGTLKMSFSSVDDALKSLILLVVMLLPVVISHVLRTSVEARVKALVDYFNSMYSHQSLKLLYRLDGFRHLQIYFMAPLQSLKDHDEQKSSCCVDISTTSNSDQNHAWNSDELE